MNFEEIYEEIISRGIVIGIIGGRENFVHYRNFSILYHDLGEPFREPSKPYIVTHAIMVIGYGINSSGKNYYIIQNSHGVSWGYGGLGKISL